MLSINNDIMILFLAKKLNEEMKNISKKELTKSSTYDIIDLSNKEKKGTKRWTEELVTK